MSFIDLRNEIESLVGMLTPTTTYLRQTGHEANVELENLEINQPIALHIDQTTITGQVSPSSGNIYKSYPLEIMFILKELEMDSGLRDTDALVDAAEALADQFYDYMVQSSIVHPAVPIESYELNRLDAYMLMDTKMSGVILNVTIPTFRNTNYCLQ